MKDGKKGLVIVVGKGEHEAESGVDPGREELAEEIISAVEDGDPSALDEALYEYVMACQRKMGKKG